ncbi:MAG: alpha/beta hydrolase [Bacteroidales bacterium]
MAQPDFIYRYIPSADTDQDAPTMLLLHGTGGSEEDLLPLMEEFGEQWNYLSPRGKVLEHGMPRFFRRLAEGVFDQEDLKLRTAELADFVRDAAVHHGFNPSRVVALGYSNGANIAASMLLGGYLTLRHAILMHPMVPFFPKEFPDLAHNRILITAGENDPVVPHSNTLELEQIFRESGAHVELFWHDAGHSLAHKEIRKAVAFSVTLKKHF